MWDKKRKKKNPINVWLNKDVAFQWTKLPSCILSYFHDKDTVNQDEHMWACTWTFSNDSDVQISNTYFANVHICIHFRTGHHTVCVCVYAHGNCWYNYPLNILHVYCTPLASSIIYQGAFLWFSEGIYFFERRHSPQRWSVIGNFPCAVISRSPRLE